MTRAAAHRALASGKPYVDPLCPSPAVHVLYGGPKQLSGLSARSRRALRGRVVAAWSTSRAFALHGVRPGASLARARQGIRLGRGVQADGNTWYFVANARRPASSRSGAARSWQSASRIAGCSAAGRASGVW